MIHAKTLPSGLRLVHRYHASPVAYVGIAVGVGTRHEGRGQHGLAHFTEHMLFKGTTTHSAKEIILALEEVGGELNAYTSKEETILYALCPREYTERALKLMLDIVQHSIFAPEELSKEQTVVIDEIHSYEDSPSELIWDEFEDLIFRGHPLGHSILGTERSVASFTQAKERRFYAEHYRPERMAVFLQGDVETEPLEQLLAQAFEGRPSAAPQRYESVGASLLEVPPRRVVRRRGTSQRHVLIGSTAYSLHDKRRLGLSLLVNILGGPGMSSRLNMSLREERGYVYQIDCSYTAYSDTGLMAIAFGCAPQHEEEAIALVMAELHRMSREPLTKAELLAAKRQLKGQLTVASDAYESYFLSLGKAYLHYDRVEEREELMKRIDALRVEDLAAIAHEVFAPERQSTLIYR